MFLREWIRDIPYVRGVALAVLRKLGFDLTLTNSWTGDKFFLHSFRHKSYWYFGKQREAPNMAMFQKLINSGDTVIEVGGHIGYISQYFSRLVGPAGKVIVFEPGSNNAPYIYQNTKRMDNILLERIAITDRDGTAIFFEDNITGQNNSLNEHYEVAELNAKSHGMELVRNENSVQVSTLDSYIRSMGRVPDFIKIDIESNELKALLGGPETLKSVKALMIEVTCDHALVSEILTANGYSIMKATEEVVEKIERTGDYFAVRGAFPVSP